jgi:hypothetical protein
MHRAGASILGRLLSEPAAQTGSALCGCGHRARYHDTRARQLLTMLGPVQFQRGYFVCPHCQQGQSPRDREMDVDGTEFSPGLRRMMAAVEAGEQKEIRQAKQLDLPEVCAPAVPVFYIEMDGTGVPVTKKEREGRAGKNEGQPARTREVKLGCVFTQTTTDEEGWPIRDPDSTSYVAAIEPAEEFGLRLYTEAWRRGWSKARQKVVLGDGAIWIWNLAGIHFPGAIQIVDLYHARQHIWELAAKLYPQQDQARKQWTAICVDRLDDGKIEALLDILRKLDPANEELAKDADKEIGYFARNAERMRYPRFRAQALFVGSGVVEAGCRIVVGMRLKCSGMFWTVRGANAILALRCCRLSNRFEDYWESPSRAA